MVLLLLPLLVLVASFDPGWEETAPLSIPPATTTTSLDIIVIERGTHLASPTTTTFYSVFTPGKLPNTTITGIFWDALTVAPHPLPIDQYCFLLNFHHLPAGTACDGEQREEKEEI